MFHVKQGKVNNMIKVKNKAMTVKGTMNEINDDVITFIETFMNNKSISKLTIGKIYDNISNYFCVETLLRYIFTICSLNEDEFHNLLKSVYKILDEINSGEFTLIYKV